MHPVQPVGQPYQSQPYQAPPAAPTVTHSRYVVWDSVADKHLAPESHFFTSIAAAKNFIANDTSGRPWLVIPA